MSAADLTAHLQCGITHVCTCWSLTRLDGVVFGFTDHDRALVFDAITFSPHAGMSAQALAISAGLAVDNSAALGVLSDASITETDIHAGRYDGAQVVMYRVQWDNVSARQVKFRGTLGEITRTAGGFEAELLGLTDALNQPHGRSYLKTCSAILGDTRCRVALNEPNMSLIHVLTDDLNGTEITLDAATELPDHWFEHGFCEVVTGVARGLRGLIKSDRAAVGMRRITLWTEFAIAPFAGDEIRLIAGCDKRSETCREKFSNILNFQGFPDIPGDDWLVAVPRSDQPNTGGSRR